MHRHKVWSQVSVAAHPPQSVQMQEAQLLSGSHTSLGFAHAPSHSGVHSHSQDEGLQIVPSGHAPPQSVGHTHSQSLAVLHTAWPEQFASQSAGHTHAQSESLQTVLLPHV